MSYENAPATKMLATHCAICSRSLVDALSVETGIGPDCRENSGYYVEVNPEARAEANKLVHAIALGMDPAGILQAAAALRVYGFDKLAATVLARKASIVVEDWGDGTLAIFTPFHSDFVARLKTSTPWRKWDGAQKCWLVPSGDRVTKALWAAMKWCYPNSLGIGPKGPFVTPAAEY